MQLPRRAPVLTDGTVTLRAHRPDDVDDCLAQCRDPQMQRWTTVPAPYRRRDAEEFISTRAREWTAGRSLSFAIELGGRFAGTVDIRPEGAGAAAVGYGLGPWARGQGVTERALRLILPWAFEAAGLDVVLWRAVAGNWASRRVAWSVGFRVEGTVRGLLADRGTRADAWIGSLRRGDPMSPHRPWHVPPVLRGPGMVLRAHRPDDVTAMVEACADPLTQHWLPALPAPYEQLDALAHLEQVREEHATGDGVYWAISTEDGSGDGSGHGSGDGIGRPAGELAGELAGEPAGRLAGEIGLFGLAGGVSRSAELGYWIHPADRGHRLAGRAVRLAARHALLPAEVGGLGLARVLIRAADGNPGSQRTALSAGFRPAGADRAAERLRDGGLRDLLRFDLVAQECPQ